MTDSSSRAPLPQSVLSTEPYFLPTLIGAMAASLGVMVGSVSPWATVVLFTINGLDASWSGLTTLTLGALSAVVVLVLLLWSRTPFDPRRAVPLAWAVAVAGVACLTISLPILVKVITSPTTEVFRIKIGPSVGWGLWLLAFSAAALCVTAAIVATQIAKNVQLVAPLGQSQASLANDSRMAAIIASAVIIIAGIIYYSINWQGSLGGSENSPSDVPSMPSFPSFTMPSFPSYTAPSFPTYTP